MRLLSLSSGTCFFVDSVALFETGSSFLVAWGLERQVHQVDEEEKVEDDGGRAQPHGNEEGTQKLEQVRHAGSVRIECGPF